MYEYKLVKFIGSNHQPPEEQVVNLANAIANHGWILVSVTVTQLTQFQLTAFFKRKKK